MVKLSYEQKIELLNKVDYWWHTIDFGEGIKTKGYLSENILNVLSTGIPDDLTGKTVLDIGSWDGYFSFLSEKRGAKEVIAIDNNPYLHRNNFLGFRTAKKIFNSKVKFIFMDLYDIPEKLNKKFDIILLYGVLYHLKNPLLALEIISKITKDVLVIESYCTDFFSNTPLMKFYPNNELNNDSTNWWGPNKRCIIEMLKVVGFKRIEVVKELRNLSRIIIRAYKK